MPPLPILVLMGASAADVFIEDLRGSVQSHIERRSALNREWESFRTLTNSRRSKRILASYWCRSHNCSLAVVLSSPLGPLVHLGRYHLSPALNEATSTAAGRARNTSNGSDRWNDRTLSLADVAECDPASNVTVGIDLNCPHIRRRFISSAELLDDVAQKRIRKF